MVKSARCVARNFGGLQSVGNKVRWEQSPLGTNQKSVGYTKKGPLGTLFFVPNGPFESVPNGPFFCTQRTLFPKDFLKVYLTDLFKKIFMPKNIF